MVSRTAGAVVLPVLVRAAARDMDVGHLCAGRPDVGVHVEPERALNHQRRARDLRGCVQAEVAHDVHPRRDLGRVAHGLVTTAGGARTRRHDVVPRRHLLQGLFLHRANRRRHGHVAHDGHARARGIAHVSLAVQRPRSRRGVERPPPLHVPAVRIGRRVGRGKAAGQRGRAERIDHRVGEHREPVVHAGLRQAVRVGIERAAGCVLLVGRRVEHRGRREHREHDDRSEGQDQCEAALLVEAPANIVEPCPRPRLSHCRLRVELQPHR
jgi:hypothetical protein